PREARSRARHRSGGRRRLSRAVSRAARRSTREEEAAMRAGARGAVVVTGASKGIGRACALRLERLGFHVFAGIRDPADGDALLAAAAGGLRPLRIDVADPDSIAAAEREVAVEVGADGLAALVNNAGIAIAGPLEFLPIDE